MLRDFLKKTITILLVVMMITQYFPHSASGEGLSGSDISQGGISSIWHDLFGFGDAESKSTESKSTESNEVEVDTNEKSNSNNDSVETEDKNEPADQIEVGEPTDTVVSVSEKDESLTPLYQNLIIDVSDNLGGKVNAVEFKLTQTSPKSNEANVRTGKTIRGKLVFNGLEKGEYLLETSKNLTGFDQTRLKYKVTVSDDASFRVTDLLNNREASTTTGKESIVNNNLILSLEAKKTSGNIISIPISIQALKRDKLTRLSLYADLNEAFADQTYNISAGEGTYNSGKYKFTDISFDSSNKWTANIKLKIKDGKLDKADVKKIFENIYLDNDGKKVNITSPLLYMSEVVENTKLNVDLIRKEEPEVKPYKKTELPISPRSLTASEMSKSVDLDATDELPPVMLDSIIEATVNNALLSSNELNSAVNTRERVGTSMLFSARSATRTGASGTVIVNKIEKGKPNVKLPGATFELLSNDKARILQTQKTGTTGEVRFTGIEPGLYYLRESEAPNGYSQDDTYYVVFVDANGNTQLYNKKDTSTPIEYTIPNASSDTASATDREYIERAYIRSKIVDVDYKNGTYTQVIYVNPNAKEYTWNTGVDVSGRNRDNLPILGISRPGTTSASVFNNSNTRVEAYVVPSSYLNGEVKLHNEINSTHKAFRETTITNNKIEINFYSAFWNPGYSAIVRITSKFDKNSDTDLTTGVNFDAKLFFSQRGNNYEYKYASSLSNIVKKPEPVFGNNYEKIYNSIPNNSSMFKFDVENEKVVKTKGRLEINKTNGESILGGAKFKLEDKSNSGKVSEITTVEGQTAVIDNIDPGKYTLKELIAPKGYVLTSETWDVLVESNGNLTITKNGEGKSEVKSKPMKPNVGYLTVVNKKGTLEVKKVDFLSWETGLEDAVFELYMEDNNQPQGSNKVSTGIKASSSKEGIVNFSGLDTETKYWLKEISAPLGYEKEKEDDGSDKYYGPFVIDGKGVLKVGEASIAQQVNQPYIIANKKVDPKKGKLIIEKQDSKGRPLAGAEFTIYSTDDFWTNIQPLTTSNYKLEVNADKNTFTFSDLNKGKYVIKETKSPNGYILSNDVMKVEVKDDGQTIIQNANIFNRTVNRLASAYDRNSVSMTEGNRTRGSSGFFSLASRGVTRLMSSEISGTPGIARSSLGSTRDAGTDPLELAQIYNYKDEPTTYIIDDDGKYPTDPAQTDPTVRNSKIPLDGLHWYESIYKQPNFGKPVTYKEPVNLKVAGVNKYAKESKDASGNTIEGEYDINLKTQGNLVNPSEKVDIMLVYDNSNSMEEKAVGSSDSRFTVAKRETTKFINSVLTPENKASEQVRMGIVSYATDLFDGRTRTYQYGSATHTINTSNYKYTYDKFTTDKDLILGALPKKTMSNEGSFNTYGGTFTSRALQYAGEILNDPTKSPASNKKIIIHITDGIPTKSLKIKRVNGNGKAEFYGSDSRGDGSDYYLTYKDFWVSSLKDLHKKYTTEDGVNVVNNGLAAEMIAKNLMHDGVEIYTLGLELPDVSEFRPMYEQNGSKSYVEKDVAVKLMKSISSENGKDHYFDVTKADQLSEVFKEILKRVPQRTVHNGQTTDPMGEMVDLKLPSNWSNGLTKEKNDEGQETGYYIIYDGTTENAAFPVGFNFELTASKETLKSGVKVLYNPTTRTIKMDNFTLGEKEWLNLKYKVNLRTTDPKYNDNIYYQTNGVTELQPNKDFSMKWRYPVPSVKGPINSIMVEKEWKNSDGSLTTGQPIKVKLQKRSRDKENNRVVKDWEDATKAGTNETISLQLDDSSDWKGKFKNLLTYDTLYKYDYRVVEENVPEGYVSSTVFKDKDGRILDNSEGFKDGRGYVTITNTKKKQIKIKKTWKTDEDTSGKTVTVHLKAFKGDTNTPLKLNELLEVDKNAISMIGGTTPLNLSGSGDFNITTTLSNASNNWEVIFKNLPNTIKDTASGKSIPIIYRVEEDQVDGYEVDYNYSDGTLGVVNYKVPKLGFKNEKNKIEFIKTDENGDKIAEADLKVAKFVLKRTDEPGSAPIDATREGSKFIFEGLSPGRYQLWEAKAPNNYDKPNTALTEFEVDQEGRIGTPVALHVINSSTTAPEDKYLKEDNGYKIKNYKKDMKFKFEKVAPIGPNSTTVLAEGELKLELYEAKRESDESKKIDGVFENSYDLSQQGPGKSFVVPITKDKVSNGIYYIKETQAPAGYAIGSDKIYIEVDWDNRTIKQVKNPFDEANKKYVGDELYKEVNNGADECLSILRIVNNRIELPRSGGIGPHVISLAGIGIMLAATFVYRRRVY